MTLRKLTSHQKKQCMHMHIKVTYQILFPVRYNIINSIAENVLDDNTPAAITAIFGSDIYTKDEGYNALTSIILTTIEYHQEMMIFIKGASSPLIGKYAPKMPVYSWYT
eukprot:GHVR01072741.1.p1 GENE.GHVR01072741.1~~GHVR01072741.1.p1  ORF type:complete len:109 (+),score=8.83 GHVR01072741.1:262-588(+)